ncbi:MAG: hypothetical protein MH252_02550 [Thermosynechococcaceae cyanobacterium MS004]|nr:hypothetical protein [Thermosynechococcaceae cyanobacterium MS004]
MRSPNPSSRRKSTIALHFLKQNQAIAQSTQCDRQSPQHSYRDSDLS